MSTLRVHNIRHDLANSDSIQLASDGSVGINAPGGYLFRNRFINGDMRIDQRNNGAELQDADGNVMTAEQVQDFLATLP